MIPTCAPFLRRAAAAALTLALASGCETYKVVDESIAGFVAGEEYEGPTDEMAKQLEEAQKMAEEAQKAAEEAMKMAEEAAKAAEAAEAAEEAAKDEIAEMEMAELKAEVDAALDDLKAEKAQQDEVAAMIEEFEAKEDALIAKYEEEAQEPTRVNIKVYADADTNLNANGEASPVAVRLVALTSEHQLMGTDYFALQDDLVGTLGTTFIGELSEVSAEPGQFVSTGELEIPRTTQKIGVIASFADVDTAIWRDNIAVRDRGDEVALLVALGRSAVRIMREGEGPRPIVAASFTEPVLADPVGEDAMLDPLEADIFDGGEPVLIEELPIEGDLVEEEIFLPGPIPEPAPEILYDAEAGSMVFLDGTTRMDSGRMLDPVAGEGSVNTALLMRDPGSVEGFDVRTLIPFTPAQDFWDTSRPLFTTTR